MPVEPFCFCRPTSEGKTPTAPTFHGDFRRYLFCFFYVIPPTFESRGGGTWTISETHIRVPSEGLAYTLLLYLSTSYYYCNMIVVYRTRLCSCTATSTKEKSVREMCGTHVVLQRVQVVSRMVNNAVETPRQHGPRGDEVIRSFGPIFRPGRACSSSLFLTPERLRDQEADPTPSVLTPLRRSATRGPLSYGSSCTSKRA